MMTRYLYLTTFALCIIFASCKKETIEPINEIDNSSQTINSPGVLIQVIDQSGSPLPGTQVELNSVVKISDNNGIVQFRNIELPSINASINLSKQGYFENHHIINPSSSTDISVVVTMSISNNTTLNSLSGGQIQCGGGAFILFPSNAFLNQDGTLFSGNVIVSSKYLDPSDPTNNDILPNSFSGINESGSNVFVENHGVIVAEIKDELGNKLYINPSNKAELHIPLMSTDISSAPNELPLYYFNAGAGKWLKEGSATLVNNEYVGTVDHFTFWMCPYVYDHYSLSGFFECSGTAYSGAVVRVYNQYGHLLGSRTTSSIGGFSGSIPGTLTHTLQVEDPCGQILYSESIGPFTGNTSLGIIDICSSGTVNYGLVEASLSDCAGSADSQAYLNVQFSGKTRFFPANSLGTFSRLIVFCNNTTEAVLVGANMSSNLSSQPQTLPVSLSMNFGNQLVCNLPDEYCTYTLNGENFFIVDSPEKEFTANLNFATPSQSAIVFIDTVNPGPYSTIMQHFQIRNFNPTVGPHLIAGNGGFGYVFEGYFGVNGTTFPVELTYVGTSVGDYVEGVITGDHSYVDGWGNNITVGPAQFRIKIDSYVP